MRYLKIIFVLFLVLGCQKTNEKHIAIGTWYKCLKDGGFIEYKITDNYLLMLTTNSEEILLFKNKVTDKTLILSEFQNGTQILMDNDTLVTISKSKNKIVLRSTYTFEKYEFNRAEFKIDEIDSANLELWKTKTLTEFKKRAKIKNCPDIRIESEKSLDTLEFDMELEEEIPIEIIEK